MSLVDKRAEMAEMYAQGYSMTEIADNYDTSRQRVHQILAGTYTQAHGGSMKRQEYDARLRSAHARIIEGVSTQEEEAEQMGVQLRSLQARFREHGLRLPSRQPPSPEHGTYYRYQTGCRCDECKAARRTYWDMLAERGPPEHGTVSGYRNYRCRCPECKAAGSRANRRDLEKRKERKRQAAPLD